MGILFFVKKYPPLGCQNPIKARRVLMNFNLIALKLRSKITKFSGILSKKLDKTAGRFIREAIYGIMASQSVMLTEIGRQLESKISLKKIEERFSRQLYKSEIWQHIHDSVLKMAREHIKDDTLLILDLSDIKKKYAEKMEYLAQVRDGSEEGEIVDGYWTTQVIAAEPDSNEIVPMYLSLYSQASPDFISENEEILKAIDHVSKYTDNKGTWVIDRGADRDILYESLLKNKRDFIIRLVGSRDLIYTGKSTRSLWLAYACPLPYKETIIKFKDGREVLHKIQYGFLPVELPEFKVPLTMVVVKGFDVKPMMLLTTIHPKSFQKDLFRVIKAYLKRWSIEDTIRFIKQTYDLENIRVLKYVRLRNMMALLLAVFYFVAVILDQSQKLTVMTGHVLKIAKRVFGIPNFKYYAIGDGISNIFKRFPGKIFEITEKIPVSQLKIEFG